MSNIEINIGDRYAANDSKHEFTILSQPFDHVIDKQFPVELIEIGLTDDRGNLYGTEKFNGYVGKALQEGIIAMNGKTFIMKHKFEEQVNIGRENEYEGTSLLKLFVNKDGTIGKK